MAFPSRSHLFGLLLLLSLPPEGAAALAALSSGVPGQPSPAIAGPAPGDGAEGGLESRMRRIEAALRDRQPLSEEGPGDLAYTFVNGPGLGWGNGGFRNGGFYNGGFRNGGFYNGGFRNGGFANGGGFRNGGGWRNGGGGAWRNGGFRNHW